MKPALTYLGLEPYVARYTELLSAPDGWAMKAFEPKFRVTQIVPTTEVTAIQNGRVLDSVNRPLWAMEQMSMLLKADHCEQIYFDDFFHPGLEALPYSGRTPNAYAFCWAQTFDRFDFTREMTKWMRPYEAMAFGIFAKVFVASPMLFDLTTTAFPGTEEQVAVVGLPFNSREVRKKMEPTFQPGEFDVVFASRFDPEKQPELFLDLVEKLPNLKFAICTGHEEMRGQDYTAVARLNRMLTKNTNLTLFKGLEKSEYYSILSASKVQFNASQQDWVSFTLLEALTFGCLPCYPMFRDFPHVFAKFPQYLYPPGDVEAAGNMIEELCSLPSAERQKLSGRLQTIVEYHDLTLDRIGNIMLNDR